MRRFSVSVVQSGMSSHYTSAPGGFGSCTSPLIDDVLIVLCFPYKFSPHSGCWDIIVDMSFPLIPLDGMLNAIVIFLHPPLKKHILHKHSVLKKVSEISFVFYNA
jgi:hypothetical protein